MVENNLIFILAICLFVMEEVNFVEALERVYYEKGVKQAFNRLLLGESAVTCAFARGLNWKFSFENEWRDNESGIRREYYAELGTGLPHLILDGMKNLSPQVEIVSIPELGLLPISVVVNELVRGRGFGLEIVYRILTAHGKSIYAKERSPGVHYEKCVDYLRSLRSERTSGGPLLQIP